MLALMFDHCCHIYWSFAIIEASPFTSHAYPLFVCTNSIHTCDSSFTAHLAFTISSDIFFISAIYSRFMNQYFLLIACLQLWPLITPVNPASTWGPLIFIFAVSATKEAWDDYNRYLSDKKANEKEVWVVRDGIKKHV